MRSTWLAAIATVVIGMALGLAIAGRPVAGPSGIVIGTTTSSTTMPSAVTTVPATTVPTDVTTTAVIGTTTLPPTTTTSAPATLPGISDVLTSPADLAVGVVNANAVGGAAAAMVETLLPFGYTDTTTFDAEEPSDVSVVFHADGLQAEAAALAEVAGLDPAATAPAALAPVDLAAEGLDLLLVLGLDRI